MTARRRPKGTGALRLLPSGAWQGRRSREDGTGYEWKTFDRRLDALRWLAREAPIVRRRVREVGGREREQLADEWRWRCWICQDTIPRSPQTVDEYRNRRLSIDHYVPVSLGGGDEYENLRPAHFMCNIRRGNSYVPDWKPGQATNWESA